MPSPEWRRTRQWRTRPRATAGANLPTCTALPAKLLGGDIKYVNAQIVPANTAPTVSPLPNSVGGNFTGTTPSTGKIAVAYCLVVLSYSSDKTAIRAQNITIYVGLPLNTTDGGVTGSTVDPPWNFKTVQGNWNGRTEGIGGGGCTGNTSGTGAVVNGFVGSGTDGGHGPGNSPLEEEPYTNVPLTIKTCQPGVAMARPN